MTTFPVEIHCMLPFPWTQTYMKWNVFNLVALSTNHASFMLQQKDYCIAIKGTFNFIPVYMSFVYRKQREKKENERQSRIRLNRRLDALRPETSSRGRHKMAENTPTVFDVVGLLINSPSDEQLLVHFIGYIPSSCSFMVVPSCRRLN